MKHTKQISTVFVAAMLLALTAFYACSKDEPSVQTLVPEAVSMSEADQAIQQKITTFKQKMQFRKDNPHFKSGETMSVDSAKWYLDAVFNYSYAYTEESFSSLNTDTFTIVLSKNNDAVILEDVCEALNEMKS